jgi:DNA-binding SARP family transcriptional activator/WD40 repeat protein
MWLGVLGSLVARDDDGASLPLAGPARRLLLAALAARIGQTVPSVVLAADLWGADPPATAHKTLQTHLMRLRRELAGPGDKDGAIVTEAAGYRLDASRVALDATTFERDLEGGAAALAAGDPEQALVHLDAALGWWRADAYAEFGDAEFAVAERIRLGELRALAFERRIDAGLRVGRGASLVADIEARLAVDPYRERSWEQLMVALYRAGRQAEALAAYRRAHARLADDLGVGPGPGLQRVEVQVLAHDDALLDGPLPPHVPAPRSGDTEPTALTCPYQGLARYEEQDAGLFVAREQLTAKLVAALRERDLLVLTGGSGSGKSSIVRAGLLPALRGGGLPGSAGWRCTVVSPPQLAGGQAAAVDLLVVDQAEETFTANDAVFTATVRRAVLDALTAGSKVVLVLRGDFYGRLAELPGLEERAGPATVLVGPLSDDALRRVICEPARRVGLTVEPELVDEVLSDVRGQPGALPLVSVALLRTWENRTGRALTVAGYRAGGGVRAALEATAEDAYLALPESSRHNAQRLLVRLATRQSGVWAHRPMDRNEAEASALLTDDVAVELLSARRLITIDERRVELVHEALLDGWPRLRDWLAERTSTADLVEHLRTASAAWDVAGRRDSDLYRGPRLASALDWRAAHPDELVLVEHQFLDASAADAQAELTESRHRTLVEARGRRRLRWVAASLALVTVAAFAGLAVATRERATAREAALSADARKVSALSLSTPDLRTSLLLSVAGYRLQDSPDSRGAMLNALERGGSVLWRLPVPGRVLFLGTDAGGGQVWSMNSQRTVYRYDVSSRRQSTSFPARASDIAALTPDGAHLVVAGPASYFDSAGAGRISIMDARTGAVERVLPVTTTTPDATSSLAAFTRDGRWLAVVEAAPQSSHSASGPLPADRVAVFDTHRYGAPPRLLQVRGAVTGLAAGLDSLAVRTATGRITVVTAADLSVLHDGSRADLVQPPGVPPGLFALSPDGSRVAVTTPGRPQDVVLLDPAHLNRPPTQTPDLDGGVAAAAFSPTGQLLALSGQGGDIDVVRTADASVVSRSADGVPGGSGQLAWAGTTSDTALYAGGADAQIRSIDLHQGPRLVTEAGRSFTEESQSFLTGSHIVTVEQPDSGHVDVRVTDRGTGRAHSIVFDNAPDQTVQALSVDDSDSRGLLMTQDTQGVMHASVLDLRTGSVASQFVATSRPTAHNTYVGVISPDGRTAAFAVGDHRLETVALPSGRPMSSFAVHFTGPSADRHLVYPLGYAPDGRLLVAGLDFLPPVAKPTAGRSVDPAGAASASATGTAPQENDLVGVVDLHGRRLVGQAGLGAFGIVDAWAWSPDGKQLAVGTYAGTMRVVGASDAAPATSTVRAVSGVVQTLSWSPDGDTVVSGGSDGTMSFWDPATLRRLGSPVMSERPDSWWAWFTPAGDLHGFAPAQASGRDRWFTMPGRADEWARAACRLADSRLSRAEWARYVGSRRAYSPTC